MNLKEIKRDIYIYTSSLIIIIDDDKKSGGLYPYIHNLV